jgi:hypothetical protein
MADVERYRAHGHCGRGTRLLIEAADSAGATVQVSPPRVLPHEMFMEQIRRFAAEVLPALQATRSCAPNRRRGRGLVAAFSS